MDSALKKKTIIGTFWSAIDRFSVQGINFILSLIIARLLNPSDYGIIAMNDKPETKKKTRDIH